MQLPFTPDQFFEVFAEYNRLFWMIALGWWLASLAAVTLVWRSSRHGSRALTLFLGVLWLWNAAAYHALLFTRANQPLGASPASLPFKRSSSSVRHVETISSTSDVMAGNDQRPPSS